MLSVYATTATPTAGSSSATRSAADTSGTPGSRQPRGDIADHARRRGRLQVENAATTAAASTHADQRHRGARRSGPRRRTAARAPPTTSSTVGPCTSPSPAHERRQLRRRRRRPSTGTPVVLAELPDDHEHRRHRPCSRPAPAWTAGRRGSPAGASQASRHSAPTTTASAAASAAYRAGSPAASGATTVAVSSAVVDSGPTDSCRDEPSRRTPSSDTNDRPQPDDRRQPGHLGVGHDLRNEVGGDGDAGQEVSPKPRPLVPRKAVETW